MRVLLLARALVLREQAGQTLVLVNQYPGLTPPFLPGGKVEPGESIVWALVRELDEELGVECRVGPYLGAVEHRWPDDAPTHYEVNHVFRLDCPDLGDQPASREPNLRYFWCPVEDLEACDIHPRVLPRLIAAHVAGDRAPWWANTLGVAKE